MVYWDSKIKVANNVNPPATKLARAHLAGSCATGIETTQIAVAFHRKDNHFLHKRIKCHLQHSKPISCMQSNCSLCSKCTGNATKHLNCFTNFANHLISPDVCIL